jgi:hypothetical protein
MPALVAGIHVLTVLRQKDVDGRDKPGHDGVRFFPAWPAEMPAVCVGAPHDPEKLHAFG